MPVCIKTVPRCAIVGALAILALGAATQPAPAAPRTNLSDYVASKLDDFSATMRVLDYDEGEGRKINKDFGLIYKLKGDVELRYKEENKLRVDARLGASRATLINNGPIQYVKIAALGLKSKTNIGDQPGKRKTLLDVGLISDGYLTYAEGQYMRSQVVGGTNCAVFRVSYRDKKLDTSHRIVWIDPVSRVTLKREEYSQQGKLNATYFYKRPVQVAPGVWFPSTIEVYNNEGRKAGATEYYNVHVNQGLQDSIFVI